MSDHPINRVSAFVPIMMSLVAAAAIAKAFVNFKRFGPPLDEDGPWHLFMLMMLVQLPFISHFVIACRREFRRALPVFATQLSLWAIGLSAAYYIPGLY